jgi:hypothetical protein
MRTFYVLAILGALAGCEREAAPEPPGPPPAISGETLLAAPPEGWQQAFASEAPGIRIAEFIPADEQNDTWTHKISFESSGGTPPLPDPIEFVNGISADQRGTCEGFESFPTFSGTENGYPTSVHLLVCHRSKINDQSQVTMIKAIRGNERFYVITRALRGPPLAEGEKPVAEEEIAGWSVYLRAITLCDGARPEHPCPAAVPPPA